MSLAVTSQSGKVGDISHDATANPMPAIVLVAVRWSDVNKHSQGKPTYGPMQDSPYEIKDKLLRALDEEYNVVDMPAVYEVISLLEKIVITKEALERTRIGKFINELRKRTTDEQLAKRAKELVKSWRKLLPQPEASVNGERLTSTMGMSPGGMSVLGPGPGPGFGPGPGPGKFVKFASNMPTNSRYKSTSPAVVSERSTSPFSSSASNSPLLSTSKIQGSNRPATPSSYAPLPKNAASPATRNNRTNMSNKTILNTGNQSKNASSQIFKPVSPALATIRHSNNRVMPGITENSVCPKSLSPNVSPTQRNSVCSQSPLMNASMKAVPNEYDAQLGDRHAPQSTPPPTLGIHSSVDTSKTNVANKRLRKEENINSVISKDGISAFSEITFVNGLNTSLDLPDGVLPSESSAFRSCNLSKSGKPTFCSDKKFDVCRPEKRKRVGEKELGQDLKYSSVSSCKLPKVKTTQQLIADLNAKKCVNANCTLLNIATTVSDTPLEPSIGYLSSGSATLHSSDAEVSRTKSELMEKFLQSSGSPIVNSNHGSPTAISSASSPSRDYALQNSVDNCSVISTDRDASISYADPVSEEIKKILSNLPEINADEINLDDDEYVPPKHEPVSEKQIQRMMTDHWEGVNGIYDSSGNWRPWQECCDVVSYNGETLRILPYVNIDW